MSAEAAKLETVDESTGESTADGYGDAVPASLSAADSASHGLPERLGRYTIDHAIGAGGMAQLVLARMEGPGGFTKQVVIKQLHPHLASDKDVVARFLHEARLVATLEHDNIASVFDVGIEDDRYYFAMEYVPGHDLRKLIRAAREAERVLTPEEVVSIGLGLCAGLHYAHDKCGLDGEPLQIVHRDISPSNVLIRWDGAVKVVDFGVAKARTSVVMTTDGSLRGKIPYMSPEQCEGARLDNRSDVFSAGLCLWELLCGERAVGDDNEMAMLRRIAESEMPRVTEKRRDCPARLSAIIAKALARERDDRYPSADAMRQDLLGYASDARLIVGDRVLADLLGELFDRDAPQAVSDDHSAPAPTASADEATRTLSVVADVTPARTRAADGAASNLRGWAMGFAVALSVGAVGAGAWAMGASSSRPPARETQRLIRSHVLPGVSVGTPPIELERGPLELEPVVEAPEPPPAEAQSKPVRRVKRRRSSGRRAPPTTKRRPSAKKPASERALPPGFEL